MFLFLSFMQSQPHDLITRFLLFLRKRPYAIHLAAAGSFPNGCIRCFFMELLLCFDCIIWLFWLISSRDGSETHLSHGQICALCYVLCGSGTEFILLTVCLSLYAEFFGKSAGIKEVWPEGWFCRGSPDFSPRSKYASCKSECELWLRCSFWVIPGGPRKITVPWRE